jgi:hypothetical protein
MNARLRRAVLARDDHQCVYCGRRPPEVMLDADHVVPRARGGRTTSLNLVSACQGCNNTKSDNAVELPATYQLEAVGFVARSLGSVGAGAPPPPQFRLAQDRCPLCGTPSAPVTMLDGDARRIQLGYRCEATRGHQWHTWWLPRLAQLHSDTTRWDARAA